MVEEGIDWPGELPDAEGGRISVWDPEVPITSCSNEDPVIDPIPLPEDIVTTVERRRRMEAWIIALTNAKTIPKTEACNNRITGVIYQIPTTAKAQPITSKANTFLEAGTY